MKLIKQLKHTLLLITLLFLSYQNTFSQCFEIESILVDACSNASDEGFNEMVRFKVGNAAINTSNMSVSWPNNTWKGLIKNTVTATKVAQLNADIIAAGGCGQIIEPVGGVLPANATVILVTSYNMDTALNSFGALSDTIYILFQNNPTTSTGHFANYGTTGTSLRVLTITFGTCSDTVVYNRTLLINQSGAPGAQDGATVEYTPAGVATYINNGCSAPVKPFKVDAGPPTLTACAGSTITLNGTAQGHQSVLWTAPSGTFATPSNLSTTYTISPTAAGTTVVLTLTATNSCGVTKTDTINLTVTNSVTPNFPTALAFCTGATVPSLATTSPNGVVGTWNPSTINNTTNGSYVFTPNAGQCAVPITLNVTISNSITPDFATTLTVCTGATAPVLATTSPNGIVGTWNPSTVNTTTGGNYVFTPNAGQCAVSVTLAVTVSNAVTPNFQTTMTVCNGNPVPGLANTSPNGVVGTWSPSTISNTTSGSYVFTPNAGQCATSVTLTVTVNNSITPDFATTATFCSGATAPVLATTSPNGIVGTWNPSVVSNTTSGNYVFTPNAGQCATAVTLAVTVTPTITPDFATTATFCNGATAPVLGTTSPNGVAGTWNPSTVSNTANGSYVFTPNAGQCATAVTLTVTVTPNVTPDFATTLALCTGATAPVLATTSPNGVAGTWNPSTINTTTSGAYVFTPNAGQCATAVTLNVTISNSITPDLATTATFCNGTTAPVLATTSPNGVVGTWNPSTVSNTTSGNYVFTPNTGQCATSITLSVTITPSITPDFATTATFCNGATAPVLATTSPNGIVGTWNPSVVSNTANGSYVFTPNAGQCATSVTLNVTVNNNITPNFATTMALCSGATAPVLATTSPNGIVGTWNPSTINMTANGSYVFTPNTGQCAVSVTLNVTITTTITPDFATTATFCNGTTAPVLATTSPNGVVGTWNPATVSNTTSGNYVFTPNAGQCATSITLAVTVTSKVTPNFATALVFCNGTTAPTLATTSPNGIIGTWNPAIVSNTANGTYIFTPNAGACANTVTLNVTVTPRTTPITTFTYPTPICANSTPVSPQLTAGFVTGGSFSSDAGLVINPTTGTINIATSTLGSHTITYFIAANDTNCTTIGTNVFTIDIQTATVVAPITGPNSVCVGSTIPLLNATPSGVWTSNNPAIATVNNLGVVTGVSSGTVTIVYKINSNCPASVTKTITVYPLPKPILSNKFICVDPKTGTPLSTVSLNAQLPNANHTFVWTFNNAVLPTTTNTHIANQVGVYTVTATNTNTGCSATATATVGISSSAVATATVGEDFNNNQIITVNVTGGSGSYLFQLDNGVPQESNQFTISEEGEYQITIWDKNGCQEIILSVYAINYPHFFTPNGDGYNDYWNIHSLAHQPLAKIYIFDRYGKLITMIKPAQAKGWDGMYNGHELPSTDYWFKLLYKNREGADKEFQAHFSLKR
ncbi:T9SS type B sorting domain-containing protein [Flavobacterium sp. '19STA2R22 D10 B1']|uniref:T9SS type B sorting domain-containing protein n=1 Tax=Flavobacterium aerium TaxID=3037261 RepID=UPI00278C00E6|nr:T9SS type B sorting domain-containing protein [Flavobacterium sp. '19STA2R22 D10 B1']